MPAQRIVLVNKDGLKQWLGRWQFGQRGNLSQRRMLVPKQFELQFLDLHKPWQQRSIERHTNAEGQGVDQQAHHCFSAGQIGISARRYAAENHIVLSAVDRKSTRLNSSHVSESRMP